MKMAVLSYLEVFNKESQAPSPVRSLGLNIRANWLAFVFDAHKTGLHVTITEKSSLQESILPGKEDT